MLFSILEPFIFDFFYLDHMPNLTRFSYLKVGKYGSLIPQIQDIAEKMPEYGGHCPVQFVFMVDFFLFTTLCQRDCDYTQRSRLFRI